jgi:hypothetical protein
MRLMAVMSYLHTMVKGQRRNGTHGMHGLRRPPVLDKDDQSILEKFIVIRYDISSATKNRSKTPSPPPTAQTALILHIKRAAYQ